MGITTDARVLSESGASRVRAAPIRKGRLVSRLRKLLVRWFWVIPIVYGMAAVSIPQLIYSYHSRRIMALLTQVVS